MKKIAVVIRRDRGEGKEILVVKTKDKNIPNLPQDEIWKEEPDQGSKTLSRILEYQLGVSRGWYYRENSFSDGDTLLCLVWVYPSKWPPGIREQKDNQYLKWVPWNEDKLEYESIQIKDKVKEWLLLPVPKVNMTLPEQSLTEKARKVYINLVIKESKGENILLVKQNQMRQWDFPPPDELQRFLKTLRDSEEKIPKITQTKGKGSRWSIPSEELMEYIRGNILYQDSKEELEEDHEAPESHKNIESHETLKKEFRLIKTKEHGWRLRKPEDLEEGIHFSIDEAGDWLLPPRTLLENLLSDVVERIAWKLGLSFPLPCAPKSLPDVEQYCVDTQGNVYKEVIYNYLLPLENLDRLVSEVKFGLFEIDKERTGDISVHPWYKFWNDISHEELVIEKEYTLIQFFIPAQAMDEEKGPRALFLMSGKQKKYLSFPSLVLNERSTSFAQNEVRKFLEEKLFLPKRGDAFYGQYVFEDNFPSLTWTGLDPDSGIPARVTLYTQKLWIDESGLCFSKRIDTLGESHIPLYNMSWEEEAINHRGKIGEAALLDPYLLVLPQGKNEREGISPMAIASLESLRYHDMDILKSLPSQTPGMDCVASQSMRGEKGFRIIQKRELLSTLECGDHSLDLRVNTPFLPYHRKSIGFEFSFLTHKDRQSIKAHRDSSVFVYGVLEGEAQLWWKSLSEITPYAWHKERITPETWVEVEAQHCHFIHFTTSHGRLLLLSTSLPQSASGRECILCHTCELRDQCYKPQELKDLEWRYR